MARTEKLDKFYRKTVWRKVRDTYFKKQHGVCESCGGAGYIVDHIIELSESNMYDASIAYDENNLQLLCIACHNQKHFKNNEISDGFCFDLDGQIRPIIPPSLEKF